MMIQTGSQMIPLWALLVTLFCGFPAARGAAIGAAAASKSDCYRKTCMDKEYNISEATCCENQLHPGEGLSCCGEQAFNPEEATCCKVGDGHNTTAVTEGLSQKVSVCCGLKAYNKLNEMCCQSTVVTKPGPKAECCGTGAYDDDTQLCCGPENNKKIWKKTSSDNKCCGRDQFDAKTQYCSNVTVTIHSITHCGTTAYNTSHQLCCQLTVVAKISPNAECCDKRAYDDDTQLCCGPKNNKKIWKKTSSDNKCCGHDQFDAKTQYCSNVTLTVHSITHCGTTAYNTSHQLCCQLTVVAKTSPNAECCDKRAYDDDTQLCCGPKNNKKIWKKTSSDNKCCGHDQFDAKTQYCSNVTLTVHSITHCGTTAYNTSHQLCCQLTVVAKTSPNAECCDKRAYDDNTQLCCGPKNNKKILMKTSSDNKCCGHDQFDAKTQYCSNVTVTIHSITHCGTTAYNTSHQLCCQLTVVAKTSPNAECCDKQAINGTQLCCGPIDNKTILMKTSSDNKCCGHEQFDSKTHYCNNEPLKIQPISTQQQRPAPQPICTEPDTRVCGSSCYNTRHFSCCERNKEKSKGCCATGRGADAAPAVYNPHTHVCCDGCLSERRPPIDLSHGSTEQHCCGTGVYWPHTEICCDGHSHQRKENTHCCGVKAYNIKNTRMKCCAGTLYNLTGGHEAQCCGSLLLTPPNVCCSSEDMEVLYAAKTGFGCCDHSYYNATLWSCCAGKLSPVHQPAQQQMIKESRLLSVNNLNEADLCEKMQIGTVQSVSPHSIVFINVLKINGRDATVTALASPHILKTPDRCSSPKLTPGKTYFLNKVNVFTDFNHESIPQSLHFITSKCKRPVTTSS